MTLFRLTWADCRSATHIGWWASSYRNCGAVTKVEISTLGGDLDNASAGKRVPRRTLDYRVGRHRSLKHEKASFPIFRHNGRAVEMVMGEMAGAFEAPLYGMLAVQRLSSQRIGAYPVSSSPSRPTRGRVVSRRSVLGRRVGGYLGHVSRYGGCLWRRSARYLYSCRCTIWIVQATTRHPDAGAADTHRHHVRSLAYFERRSPPLL